jgi:ATP-dependent protease ClpP protease subunit
MEAIINIKGVIGQEFLTEDLVAEVKANKDADSFKFIIDSDGGYTDEGFAMAYYIESLDKPTITVAKKVYSIANVIFFASKNREYEEGGDFMLHMAWLQPPAGNKKDLQFFMELLDREDQKIKDFIMSRSGLLEEDLTALMNKDTYIDIDKAQKLGFFESVNNLRLVALANKPNEEMSKTSVYELIEEVKNLLSPSKKPEVKNMDIELEDGENIFVESEDGELEGKTTNAPAGTHRLKDGRTITVVEGENGNVVESVSEDATEAEAMEDGEDEEKKMLAKENEELKAKVEELEAKALAQKTENEEKLKEVENDLNFIKKNLQSQEVPAGKQPTYSNDANNNPTSAFQPQLSSAQKLMKEIEEKNKNK